jgi:hypothetical protein
MLSCHVLQCHSGGVSLCHGPQLCIGEWKKTKNEWGFNLTEKLYSMDSKWLVHFPPPTCSSFIDQRCQFLELGNVACCDVVPILIEEANGKVAAQLTTVPPRWAAHHWYTGVEMRKKRMYTTSAIFTPHLFKHQSLQ